MRYNAVIVGAGPAGIFAALELASAAPSRVLIIEKGRDIGERARADIFHGWGGAGAFSDGKLTLSGQVGGLLADYLDDDELEALILYVDSLFLEFGAAAELKGADRARIARIEEAASRAGLRLVPFPVRHIGTDRCAGVLTNLRRRLEGKADLLFNTEVAAVAAAGGRVTGVRLADGRLIEADHVLLCPGRAGSRWLQGVASSLGIKTAINPVDIGVRVETPASVMRDLTDALHEAKLLFNSRKFDDPVRTFCMNPYGVVVKERHEGFCTVNGHSFSAGGSDNTNFAILVSTTFTEPFHEPVEYGRHIAGLAGLLGSGVIVQRLGDLRHGRRSTPERMQKGAVRPTLADATPGDLSFVLPYRYVSDVLEMIEALDGLAPGVNGPSTLLYGVEVKFYSVRLDLTRGLETRVENLFAAGDGAGVTRGIVQASASGIVAAREILKRMGR